MEFLELRTVTTSSHALSPHLSTYAAMFSGDDLLLQGATALAPALPMSLAFAPDCAFPSMLVPYEGTLLGTGEPPPRGPRPRGPRPPAAADPAPTATTGQSTGHRFCWQMTRLRKIFCGSRRGSFSPTTHPPGPCHPPTVAGLSLLGPKRVRPPFRALMTRLCCLNCSLILTATAIATVAAAQTTHLVVPLTRRFALPAASPCQLLPHLCRSRSWLALAL